MAKPSKKKRNGEWDAVISIYTSEKLKRIITQDAFDHGQKPGPFIRAQLTEKYKDRL